MGRNSVGKRREEILAAPQDHIRIQTVRVFAALIGALIFISCSESGETNGATCCAHELANEDATLLECAPVVATIYRTPREPSWIFRPSTFTHDPATGDRVAQYLAKEPVEPLDDPRAVTSRYRQTRTTSRGRDGSYDNTYQVQAWGNGRGGIDAQWERFHDAWKESILSGGFYNYNQYHGPWDYGNGWYNSWNSGWNNNWDGGAGWNHRGDGGGGFPHGPTRRNRGWIPGSGPRAGSWYNGPADR